MYFFAALLNLALLTINEYPDSKKVDDNLLKSALLDYQIEAQSIDWKATDVNWADFDAVLIYSTWDYHLNHPMFLKVLKDIQDQGVAVFNSPEVIEWNSSKIYLQDLENLGLKPIESIFLSPSDLDNLPSLLIEKGWDDCVIKPQISASGHHTERFNLSTIGSVQEFFKGSTEELIVQPFAEEILTEGEWSFVFFNGEYIHCVLKKPLEGNFRVQKGSVTPIEPPDWMIAQAQHIMDTIALPALKARVDVIRRGNDLRIMEIELIEPNLYLKYFPGSEKILAQKISERLGQ